MRRFLLPSLASFALLSCGLTPIHDDRDPAFEAQLRAAAQDAIARRVFPGCSILVLDDRFLKADVVAGRETYAGEAPAITPAHRFDLASLTKVVATTGVAMALYDRGKIRLEDPVHRYVPAFTGGGKQRVTLGMLLAHCSGLPAQLPLWQEADIRDVASAVERITEERLVYEPGEDTRYSDLGMLLLAVCLERAGDAPFAELCQTLVFAPLEMRHTSFGPLPDDVPVAPTEIQDGTLTQRIVHDENARAIGGTTGHAGLFSTAEDLGRFVRCLLDGGRYGPRQVFRDSTVARFTKRAVIVPGSSRALGWDTKTMGSIAGEFFSERTVLHTGFTGTSIVIDMEEGIGVVVLTNRVHPSREGTGIDEFRRAISDLTMRALRPARVRRP